MKVNRQAGIHLHKTTSDDKYLLEILTAALQMIKEEGIYWAA